MDTRQQHKHDGHANVFARVRRHGAIIEFAWKWKPKMSVGSNACVPCLCIDDDRPTDSPAILISHSWYVCLRVSVCGVQCAKVTIIIIINSCTGHTCNVHPDMWRLAPTIGIWLMRTTHTHTSIIEQALAPFVYVAVQCASSVLHMGKKTHYHYSQRSIEITYYRLLIAGFGILFPYFFGLSSHCMQNNLQNETKRSSNHRQTSHSK